MRPGRNSASEGRDPATLILDASHYKTTAYVVKCRISHFHLQPTPSLHNSHSSADIITAMASLETRIRSAVTEHRRLLDVLASTDHAPPQLIQQQDLISALQADIAASDARVASTSALREAEHSDHTKYRDSTFRRFAHKASGQSSKYTAKAAKEESEYLAAVQAENTEKQLNAALKSHLLAAKSLSDSLVAPAARYAQAQAELDALLSSIFDGPTASHPDEDSAESDANLAQTAYRSALEELTTESAALAHLKTAQLSMRAAVAAMKDAVIVARQLQALGERDESDKRERAALASVETQLITARVAYLQAQRVKPGLKDMPALQVDQRGIMTAMYFAAPSPFDKGSTEFGTMVQGLSDRVLELGLFVKGKVEEAGVREGMLREGVREREAALRAARERLMRVRRKALESVLGHAEGIEKGNW